MRLVQITDCHLHADPDAPSRAGFPLRQLERVVEAVALERPDVVVVTGDVSQDETAASYRLAEGVLSQLACPWTWLAGNHDDPEPMAAVHESPPEIDLGAWRALLLDTRVRGQPYGELGEVQLARLDERLAADDRPTLIAMHHPPLAVGSQWLDAIGLMDREALWQTLAAHPQVRMILCGHIHQAFASQRRCGEGRVAVYGCPSTTDQFLAGSAEFAIDEASRPGYRVVDLRGDEWLTWVERVDL
ncbi:phosphodiesterase [Billgrantia gudaonensis]|uniref:Icc protein n=1 Tax=Billgrantia gudaonensis TaxID=376427 RepID=A0A1G9AS34_9GAMM|nr:phosphodiesterase [Halomonas gudaonensis]SDK30142.1 Icc protein [Halomonas gudaonensis]